MTNPIYTPAGRAREYSPYALNIYTACTHGCKYCYVPRCMHLTNERYFAAPEPRKGIVEALRRQLYRETFAEQVLLSFVGDCFCETKDKSEAACECLKLLAESETPTAILTKGGMRISAAIPEIRAFRRDLITVGTTLTFWKDAASREWEPGAALPGERLAMLATLHGMGVRTFASFEPVICPEQSLELMRQCAELGICDVYKVGKLNNHPLAAKIDWAAFLRDALEILRAYGCEIYIKDDLAAFAPAAGVILTPRERDADAHTVRRTP